MLPTFICGMRLLDTCFRISGDSTLWFTEVGVLWCVARYYNLKKILNASTGMLLPAGAVDGDIDTTRALMLIILPVYMGVVQPVTIVVQPTSCVVYVVLSQTKRDWPTWCLFGILFVVFSLLVHGIAVGRVGNLDDARQWCIQTGGCAGRTSRRQASRVD